MKHSIELGIRDTSLDVVAAVASDFVGSPLEMRYSDYMGGYYYRIKGQDEEVRIQLNRDCDDIAEEEHPDVCVLVIIDPTTRPRLIHEFFMKEFDCVLVREKAYPME